jgi:hypothetical protein
MIEDFFHLPPVSTTQVVHLELRISPRIFEKIRNGPIDWGKLIHEKTLSRKSRDTVPLNHKVLTYIEYIAVSGVFRTIDPPPPLPLASASSPRTKGLVYTLHTRRAMRGWGLGRSIQGARGIVKMPSCISC